MANRAVVDTDDSPASSARHRRRALFAVAAPFVVLVLVLGGFAALTFYGQQVNKRDVLGLTEDLVTAIDQRVRTQVEVFLRPAAQAVRLTGELAQGQSRTRPWPELDALFEDFALAMMRSDQALAAFYLADPDGRFTMVRRNEKGRLDTKRIQVSGNRRAATWTRRGAGGEIAAAVPDPSDRFDPRTRPWYRGAADAKAVFWSDLYVFFSSQQPGITVSEAVRGPDGAVRYVVGADIELARLSGFLADLGISKTGQAVILEAGGEVLATPNPADAIVKQDGVLRPARVEDLADPVLRGIFDRVRVQRNIHRVLKVGDTRYITAASSLEQVLNRPLWLIISAPESDFTGFIERNNRRSLLLSALIVALALILAGLLSHLRLSAERRNSTVEARRGDLEALFANQRALAEIADSAADDPSAAMRRVTEQLACDLACRRAAIWRAEGENDGFACVDCYDAEAGSHGLADSLSRADFPKLFNALERGEPLLVADAEADPRTQDVYRRYLQAFGSRSLAAAPIQNRNRLAGVVWVEDGERTTRLPDADIAAVLGYAAAVVRPWLAPDDAVARGATQEELHETAGRTQRPAAQDPASGPSGSAVPLAGRRHARALRGAGLDASPEAVVLWITLGRHAGDGGDVGSDRAVLVAFIAQVAQASGIAYVRQLGDQFVLATGLDQGHDNAARVLGRAAIAIRAEYTRLFAEREAPLTCRMGLAAGAAVKETSSSDAGGYNLWGACVDAAASLSASAPDRAIQLDESAYALMKVDFAVSHRGVYYLEEGGETQTYLLQGEV